MKANFLVCLLLLNAPIGTVRHSVPLPRTQSRAIAGGLSARRASLAKRLTETKNLFQAGNFQEAAVLARQGALEARSAGERQIAVRFLNNLGGSYFALHQYREALTVYLDARGMAESSGDFREAGKLDFNISSLYFQLGQMDAAIESGGRAMSRLSGEKDGVHLPKLLIHMATLRARQNRMPESLALFRRGIEASDRAGDLQMYTLGWSDLGEEYLQRGQFRQAEYALLEAYRLRKLNHLRGLENSYRNLGLLRLEQGDIRSASELLDQAVKGSNRPGGSVPTWEIYYARGRVRLAQNRLPDALNDFRVAARLARTWRRAVPPDDASRVSAENSIQSVHSALVEAGNKLYFANGDRALARETFEAAEANRAASLRILLSESRTERRQLPPKYWETLERLQSAQVALLRGQDPSAAEQVQRLQGALIQLESVTGSGLDLELPGLFERTRAALEPDTLFLGFHLAKPDSYLWAVSREQFALYRLPSAIQIRAMSSRFEEAVRNGNPEFMSLGHQLYNCLFRPLSPALRRKPHWLLALDSQLFQLPFAALVEEITPDGPAYVVERHSLETTPGATMLSASPKTPGFAGPFLGVADPIYNTADPRWRRSTSSSDAPHLNRFLNLFAAPGSTVPPTPNLHLARLAGSSREAAACAAVWSGPQPPLLLQGASASRQALRTAMDRHPSVLHFATHVLHPNDSLRSGVIALSLNRDAQNEILSPAEIATFRLDGAVVCLSGCSSGLAEALPGTGLTGLTRAWQAAGARAVVASFWRTPDDAGALFLSFYRHLRARPQAGIAIALQHAQVDMIRSNSWRAKPRYWGAYFVTGNQQ